MSIGRVSRRRWWLWLPLLGLAGWLALFGDKSPDGKAAAVSLPARPQAPTELAARPSHHGQKPPQGSEPDSIEMLVRRDQWAAAAPAGPASAPVRRDLFSTRNWNPPPAPPVSMAEAAPVAPALPFAFLGKKLEGEIWEVYLIRGEQTFVVREGQTLDGVYRVDKIAPPSLALTYLPLGQSQTLPIGDSR
jgi:hypothetical protein